MSLSFALIGELVRRCRLAMAGDQLPVPDPIDPALESRAAKRTMASVRPAPSSGRC